MISETFFLAVIYRLLSTFFFQITAYYPFRHHLRYPLSRIIGTAAIAEILMSVIYACATTQGAPVTATLLMSVVVWLLVFICNVRADAGKILFLYGFVLDYAILVNGLAYFTESRLFYSPGMSFGSIRTLALILFYSALTAPVVLFFLKRTSEWSFQIHAPLFWNVAWLLPAFTTLIVLMYTSDGTVQQARDIRFAAARILLLLIMFLVYYILLRSLQLVQQQIALSEQSAQQQSLLAIQNTQYSQLTRHMEDVRQARHDLTQHLRVIQHYLDTGSPEALQDYLNRYAQTLPRDSGRIWCKNQSVNTIVSYYAQEARTGGIAFYGNVLFLEHPSIPEPDLCAMLGNLLENALYAAREYPDPKGRFIHIEGEEADESLLLTIDNSCAKEPQTKDGLFLSVRHPGYGTGTASVRAIAEKYSGDVLFHFADDVFYASIFLQIAKNT